VGDGVGPVGTGETGIGETGTAEGEGDAVPAGPEGNSSTMLLMQPPSTRATTKAHGRIRDEDLIGDPQEREIT
jgi:hypothetical protein